MEAAVLTFCIWITQYGIPERLSSDIHGAFTADVARIICDILGISNRVFSAVYHADPRLTLRTQLRACFGTGHTGVTSWASLVSRRRGATTAATG